MDAAEASAMVVAAERAGRRLSICFEYRYWDEAVYLRERIAAGDLGHVFALRTWGGAARGYPTDAVRYRHAAAGGGVLAHWTIHNLDLALWLLGNPEPMTASAFTYQRLRRVQYASAPMRDSTVEDFGVGLMRLAGGTTLTVEANWLQPPSTRPEGWEILADAGAASISPLRLWRDDSGEWTNHVPPPGTFAPCDYNMSRLMTSFLDSVARDGPSPVTGDEVVRIQRLMDALYESARTGREVEIAPPVAVVAERTVHAGALLAQPNGRTHALAGKDANCSAGNQVAQ
jgi:predicted dehydrogenase